MKQPEQLITMISLMNSLEEELEKLLYNKLFFIKCIILYNVLFLNEMKSVKLKI